MSSQTPIGQVVFGDFYADDNNNPVDHSLSDVSFFQDNHGPVQFEQFQDNGNLQHPQLFRDNTNVMEHSNGLPVHGLPEYHGFNQLNQIHYPAGPMMMPQQISAQAPPMPPSHMLVAHHQPPPPPRKKPEELDSACRPRLTAEQTLILEDYFSHTPRPTTQQKRQHAINLNLTQEKVNNWFQNRRAKSKQQNKTRKDLELLDAGGSQQPAQQWEEVTSSDHSDNQVTSPLQSETTESTSMQSMDNSNTSTVESNILDITHWQESPEQAHTSLDQKVLPLDELDSNGGHQHTLSNDSNFFLDTSHDTFGAGTSWLMDPEIGHRIMSPPDIKSEPSLLLEQSADLTPGQVHFMHHRPSNSSLYTTDSTGTGDEHGTTFSHSTASLVHNPQVSYVVSPAESPRLTPFAHAALHGNVTAENFSRRGSTSSELANNFNGIHLQRVSSQQTSEDEVFKTPLMPPSSLNLAARRKRQRPPALVPQRTASANIPPLSSPGLDIGVPQSVRRVKSSNNSLNVIGSRVSKSGVSSAQRSPLNIASFGEAAALERLRSTVVQASNQNEAAPQLNIDPNYGDAEPTSMPDNFDLPIQTQSPTDYMSHWHHQTTSPADSLIAPPLSASFTQKSYDEGSLRNSPPVTPFTLQNPYMNQFAVPQSAPAHILSFPEFSSPAGTQPTTPSHFYAPQPQYPGAPFLVPGQGVHQPMFSHGSVPNLYDVEHHQPRISRSYSSSGQFNFFAAPPPPPQKELEVVMTEFPRPPGQKGPLLKLPQNFTFQNSGPKDYATE